MVITDNFRSTTDTWSYAHQLVKENPLAGIDCVLQQMKSDPTSILHGKKWIDLFCQAIWNYAAPNRQRGAEPQVAIFDREFIQSPRFVALCLLRLLAHQPEALKGELRNKAINLFDEYLGRDLYQKCGIDVKDQTYKKEQKLRAFVLTVESDLTDLSGSLSQLSGLSVFQENFLRKLNTSDHKAIIKPFVPSVLWDQRLQECFVAAIAYVESTGSGSLNAYHNCCEVFNSYIVEVGASGGQYARAYLGEAVTTLNRVINEHFQNSPLSKPASLRVIATDKKYPLHKSQQPFELFFVVINEGPGVAFHSHLELTEGYGVSTEAGGTRVFLGTLEPETKLQVPIRVLTQQVETEAGVEVRVEWENFGSASGQMTETFEIQAQRCDIDWDVLAATEAYSLDPVELEADLIGRRDILNKLTARVRTRSMGSSYISGQKRVGKTSIVNALQDRIKQDDQDLVWVYLLSGDVNVGNAQATSGKLAARLCRQVQIQSPRLQHLKLPEEQVDLTSVVSFLDEAKVIDSSLKVVFVLDEFDELPFEFFRDTLIGNAFFSTLRSLSSRSNVCFILVGSENMNFALSWQGDRLNKFAAHPVDYFDKESHWSDFRDLVCAPVCQWLEINDEAVEYLYEQSAGNPFFTKLLCDEVYKVAVDRRDSYISRREAEEAVGLTLSSIGATSFQHFWKDGLLAAREGAEDRSITRRKVLLALADALNEGKEATKDNICDAGPYYHLMSEEIQVELTDFVNRKVLVCSDGCYRPKVPLFERWLREHGQEEVWTRLTDEDVALASRSRAEKQRIKSEEIVALVKKWPSYKGSRVSEDEVRSWLNYYGSTEDQRVMFTLLKGLRFYSQAQVREKMREAYNLITRDMTEKGIYWSKPDGALRRHDLMISHLDSSPGKSGAHYARLFAEENNILMENVVQRASITKGIDPKRPRHALIFVDDIIGTGRSAIDNLQAIYNEQPDLFNATDGSSPVLVYIIAICGFTEAQQCVEAKLQELGLQALVRVCDVLTDEDRCFHPNSRFFPDDLTRGMALDLATRFGRQLEPKNPLGFGGCQAAVVFEASCPNNSLPILWKEKDNWKPLFKRG